MIEAALASTAAILDPAWIAGVLTSAVATWVLARFARRAGWVDDGGDAPSRKLQSVPVPLVGGAAIVLGLIAAQCARTVTHAPGIFEGASLSPIPLLRPILAFEREAWIWAALLLAFAIGLVDDLAREGLSPVHKVIGQVAVGVVLAQAVAPSTGASVWLAAAVTVVYAVVALNAINTFDNADGAATALGIFALAPVMPAAAAPLAGFLPFNLWMRDASAQRGRHTSPRAYLGDSGSHVIGVLVMLHPASCALLALPLFDLLRLCFVRRALAVPFWRGDRRHIAHRFMKAGMSPTVVVMMLLLASAPALAGALFALRGASAAYVAVGWAGVFVLLMIAVRITPSTD